MRIGYGFRDRSLLFFIPFWKEGDSYIGKRVKLPMYSCSNENLGILILDQNCLCISLMYIFDYFM